MSRGTRRLRPACHAAMLARARPGDVVLPLPQNDTLIRSVPFALLAFGTLLVPVVMAFLLLTMTKEAYRAPHKIAPWSIRSGVANRRAFLSGSSRLLRGRTRSRAAGIAAFETSIRFKDITIAWAMRGRPGAAGVRADRDRDARSGLLFSRIGGEDSPRSAVRDFGEAIAIAERVRRNFAEVDAHFSDSGLGRPSRRRHARPRCHDRGGGSAVGRRRGALPRQGQRPQPGRGQCAGCGSHHRGRRRASIVPILRANRIDAARVIN